MKIDKIKATATRRIPSKEPYAFIELVYTFEAVAGVDPADDVRELNALMESALRGEKPENPVSEAIETYPEPVAYPTASEIVETPPEPVADPTASKGGEAPGAESFLTNAQISAALMAFAEKNGSGPIIELRRKYGVKQISELSDADKTKFVKELQANDGTRP